MCVQNLFKTEIMAFLQYNYEEPGPMTRTAWVASPALLLISDLQQVTYLCQCFDPQNEEDDIIYLTVL